MKAPIMATVTAAAMLLALALPAIADRLVRSRRAEAHRRRQRHDAAVHLQAAG
jgi:hypothetical protein